MTHWPLAVKAGAKIERFFVLANVFRKKNEAIAFFIELTGSTA